MSCESDIINNIDNDYGKYIEAKIRINDTSNYFSGSIISNHANANLQEKSKKRCGNRKHKVGND